MNKAKLMVAVGFLVAFGAGLVTGMRMRQPAVAVAPPAERSWIAHELDLTPDQEKQVQAVWSGIIGRDRDGRRDAYRKERDEKIAKLLTEEQKPAYDKIREEYSEKVERLSQERRKAFESAVAQTKAILNDTQRQKYDEMLKRRPAGRGRGATTRSDLPGTRASSRPVSD